LRIVISARISVAPTAAILYLNVVLLLLPLILILVLQMLLPLLPLLLQVSVLSCHVRSEKELGDGIVDTGLHTIGSGATAATSAETGEKHYEGVCTLYLLLILQYSHQHSAALLQLQLLPLSPLI
jgi:hypothetical protein